MKRPSVIATARRLVRALLFARGGIAAVGSLGFVIPSSSKNRRPLPLLFSAATQRRPLFRARYSLPPTTPPSSSSITSTSTSTSTTLHALVDPVTQDSLRTVSLSPAMEAFEYLDRHDYLSAYDIYEDAPREVTMFKCWASDRGVQTSESFRLVEKNKGKEVHAATAHDDDVVSAGTPVLYVPEYMILSSSKAMAELRTAEMTEAENFVISRGGESEHRQWYLMLKILAEIQKGRDSHWYAWLNSLPRYYENAPAMTDYCLQCLPPLMRKRAEEEREICRRLSKDTIGAVPFLGEDLKYHPRDYTKWAYQIVYTRSFETPEDGDLKIVPMADYFDHGSDCTEIEPYFDEGGNYYAYTTYDIPAGSPLRISYADPRNPAHLLARYGFFDENCPASYCKLLPPTVNEEMLELGYSHDRMLFYRSGEVADEVWDIFLYLHLGSTNPNEQQALMRAHREGDWETKLALHERYFPITSASLLEHVDSIIAEIDKVTKKSEAHPVYVKNEHARLPLIKRHNEFVRETFDNVRRRYSPDYASYY